MLNSNYRSHMSTSGFTLVEIIITIVFISIVMVGVLTAYNNTMKASANPLQQIRAVELGQSFMDEIFNKRFDENSGQGGTPRCGSSDVGQVACTLSGNFGSEAGEVRSTFDDVDDFHGLNESPPLDSLGNARNGYDNYAVQISVRYSGNELAGIANNDAKRIEVTTTTPKGDSYTFTAYRVNF